MFHILLRKLPMVCDVIAESRKFRQIACYGFVYFLSDLQIFFHDLLPSVALLLYQSDDFGIKQNTFVIHTHGKGVFF